MTYKVIQWATGAVGSMCLKQVLSRPEFELVGLFVYSEDKEGRDAGDLVGMSTTGVRATRNKEDILAIEADCVIHCPLSQSMEELDDDVNALLQSGKNVISVASYYAPEYRGPEIAARLEASCQAGRSTLLGTGVEPGFMFDRVVPTLTGMCSQIEHIRLVETVDAARHPAVLMMCQALGIGKPLGEVTKDSPYGQYFITFFSEMVTAAGRAMGVSFDKIEAGLEAAPATKDLDIAVGKVSKGTVAGNRYWFEGYVDGSPFLTAEIHWFVEPGIFGGPLPADRYGWLVEIEGKPSLRMVMDTFPSLGVVSADYDPVFHATMATVVNAIPLVCKEKPGVLYPTVFAPCQRTGR